MKTQQTGAGGGIKELTLYSPDKYTLTGIKLILNDFSIFYEQVIFNM